MEHQHPLPVTQPCRAVAVARSSVSSTSQPVPPRAVALMRRRAELPLQHPGAGSRLRRDLLRLAGVAISPKPVATLRRRLGIAARSQRPRTPRAHPGHAVFPYLLRERALTAPHQGWAMELTDLPMRRGFGYLVGVGDWATRRVLAWRLPHSTI